jgi:hypothetical protein
MTKRPWQRARELIAAIGLLAMSGLGHERTSERDLATTALHPKADISSCTLPCFESEP